MKREYPINIDIFNKITPKPIDVLENYLSVILCCIKSMNINKDGG